MTDKKKLIAYRLKGSVAQRMFDAHPEAAVRSEVKDPKNGLGIIISLPTDDLEAVLEALRATKQLIKDKDLDEFLIFTGTVLESTKLVSELLVELQALSSLVEDHEDETE